MRDYKKRMKEYIKDLIRNELAISDDSDNENQSQLSEKAKRDYKAEYKKFQSSSKMKKYRAELNKYNRKKGTYGNGDNKDASHKGGKIVGFEAQSKNRGRAEKSRLKKEDLKKLVKKYGVDKILEACQKGYMTHPTRKTKIMFGKRYRNCVKKENVKEYTYGVGDIVKDINPTCPHNGAMGKVRSVNPKSVVFVVLNKGKNYKPGDVLDKTHDQMKKMDESLKSRMKDVMKGLAKSMKLKSVVSMHPGSGSFSYFMDDKMEAKKLAMSLKKHLKRVRLIPLDKSKGDTANFVVAADIFGVNESSAEKEKIKQYLMKKGDNEKDATDILKFYDLVKKLYKGAPPAKRAQIMSSLWANESVNEGVSKSEAQEIMRQLGGRKFEMLMGVKSKGVGKDGLILHIGKNPKKVSHIIIDLDRGKDLYNIQFGKVFKYKFKIIKSLKGIGVEQLHDTIEKYTGLLTTFRPR